MPQQNRWDLATAAIAVFESPTWLWHVTDQQNQRYRPAITGGPSIAINSHSFFPMLAKACSNPLDLLIIDELNRGEMSAKTLQETIEGLDLTASDRRLKKLFETGGRAESDRKAAAGDGAARSISIARWAQP